MTRPLRLAALLYLVGDVEVTLSANVPLNNELAAFSLTSAPAAQAAELAQQALLVPGQHALVFPNAQVSYVFCDCHEQL